MKKTAFLAVFVFLLLACIPSRKIEMVPPEIFPYDLKVEVGKEKMTLSWKTQGTGLKSGYNIYISKQPLANIYPDSNLPDSIKPYNPVYFPGDTNPGDSVNYFIAEYLEDGVKYYVSVRVINVDRTVSKPSNEVIAVCGARSKFNLAFRYRSENDGYSFALDTPVRADQSDNDIYFFSKDGVDYLASPSRLDGFLRDSKFKVLSLNGSFNDIRDKVNSLNINPVDDRITVKKGDWVLVKTADDHFVLLNVLSFIGEGDQREVELFLAYSSLTGEFLF